MADELGVTRQVAEELGVTQQAVQADRHPEHELAPVGSVVADDVPAPAWPPAPRPPCAVTGGRRIAPTLVIALVSKSALLLANYWVRSN